MTNHFRSPSLYKIIKLMSFHFQRLANKLSKTKYPTSIYQSHYSFQAKRSIKDEVYLPHTKPEALETLSSSSFQAPVVLSNWRKQHSLPHYEYPEGGVFWVTLSGLFLTLELIYQKGLKRRDQKVLDAYTNSTMGVINVQNLLDSEPINPK